MKKTYIIPCVWQTRGTLYIDADSLEEAKRIAIEDAPSPEEQIYLPDYSFEVDEEHGDYGKTVE